MKDMSREREQNVWRQFRHGVSHLVLYLIAFAHVRDLDTCEGIPLEDQQAHLSSHGLIKQISCWDGRQRLLVEEGCWLDVFSHLLTGQGSKSYDLNDITTAPTLQALVSGRGWSAYISTIGFDDPYSIDTGRITITKGVPNRNGVFRRGVMDGPFGRSIDMAQNWELVEKGGDLATLRCADDVELGRPRCGEYKHLFMFTLRVQPRHLETQNLEQKGVTHLGFRHMHRAVWRSKKSEPCDHQVDEREQVQLPPGCQTMRNICSGGYEGSFHKVTICLTAHRRAARWRALCEVADLCGDRGQEEVYGAQNLLRGDDCCFACAIDQVAASPGRSFVIL